MTAEDTDSRQSFEAAAAALRGGDAATAMKIARRFLAARPASVPHLHLMARALVAEGRLDEALAGIDFALSVAPDFALLHDDRGNILARLSRLDEAIDAFRRAVELDPRLASAWRRLARALVAAGRSAEVDEAFEGFLDHDEDAALVAAGAEHWRANRCAEAEAVLGNALRRNPDNVDAMRFLAMVYQSDGDRLADAEALLRRATTLAPDFHQAWMDLGHVLFDSGKWTDAVDAMRRRVGLTPEDADAWTGLGRALAFAGDIEAACSAYETALRLQPVAPGVHMAHAHMLKTLGRQAEALAAYRRSIAQNPGLAESYWSMANLKVYRFTPDEVAQMERQAQRPDLSDAARVSFCFALGKAHEDAGDHARAWTHFHRGNSLQRQLVDYDPVEHEQFLGRVRRVFTHELFERNAGCGHPAPDPIFVVGLPRSGSTLVEQILASHSQVEGTSELADISLVATGTGRYRGDGLLYPETVGTLTGRDFASYGREYLRQVARHRVRGTPRFIDKMPNNFVHVGWIGLILPNARIIDTRRHPLDSCLAAYRQLFAKGQHFTYDMFELAEYYRGYVGIMEHWDEVLPGQVLRVHYEDTVTDLESQVRRILDFCGLGFEEACLRFFETERAVKTASSEQVRQPIYTGAMGLWKEYRAEMAPWEDSLADILTTLPPSVVSAAG